MNAPRHRTLFELLMLSDLGRANPERARELLDRCADPIMEERNDLTTHTDERKECGREAA